MNASAPSLRILFVDTELVWRGGQEQLLSLISGMKERGHQVWLAAPRKAPLAGRARSRGISCLRFRQRSEFSPAAFWKLWRILKKENFQVIYFNTPRAILAGSLAARASGTPFRISSRRVNFPLKSVFSRFKYNRLLDSVVTVSESIRHTLMEDGVRQDMIHVVYEGVDLDWIDSLTPPGLFQALSRPIVGIVAHLSPEKGHRTLLQAARRIAGRFPQATYALVGDGPLRQELDDLTRQLGLQERVVFTGFRSDSEALMKELDIFCLPSLSEGLSSAILSAMASSLPVIATDVGGIPELVVHNETGYLVPPENPEELAQAIARTLQSAPLRRKLGQAGRLRIEQHFTLTQKLDRSEKLFRDLLDGGGFR